MFIPTLFLLACGPLPDSSVVWAAYTCKNYDCLINRKHTQKYFDDCKDCFGVDGVEKTRCTQTQSSNGGLGFSIDEAPAPEKPGTIRIGLDIVGCVATFAARTMERNLTIVTTSMNLNGPFNNFNASRGVVPLYISMSCTSHRGFGFSTPDRVGCYGSTIFFCVGEQLEDVYAPLIESVGFNKLKWGVGRKLDRGPELREMYLSALLEKPL